MSINSKRRTDEVLRATKGGSDFPGVVVKRGMA
jgi:hypothetical protein